MPKRILILDDSKDLLDVCTYLFESVGYEVDTRTRCENIIEDALHTKPDVILLDLNIPFIGGEEALRLVKEREAMASIPIIMFSAVKNFEQHPVIEVADGYVTKPFNITALLEIVKEKTSISSC